ncbi:MAG: mercury transporter MerT [Deltaproteobacteria bacterium]|nr:mercury transporter MerT [Deltaproteobacteria bacterium]
MKDTATARDHIATAGTLVSAALIASCCVGPALFLVFGTTIGALGSLGVLEPYRAWFIAAGYGCWGYGFYRLYLRTPIGPDGTDCAEACERPSSRARVLLWASFTILLLAITLPRLALYYAG